MNHLNYCHYFSSSIFFGLPQVLYKFFFKIVHDKNNSVRVISLDS